MFYYINQLCTPSFSTEVIKTESDFFVRSVQTGLPRRALVLAVISIDAVLFWLSQTWSVTLRIHELVFSGCIVLPASKETKPGSSNQEASPSACKNTPWWNPPWHSEWVYLTKRFQPSASTTTRFNTKVCSYLSLSYLDCEPSCECWGKSRSAYDVVHTECDTCLMVNEGPIL